MRVGILFARASREKLGQGAQVCSGVHLPSDE
jgi:hypothetical protein